MVVTIAGYEDNWPGSGIIIYGHYFPSEPSWEFGEGEASFFEVHEVYVHDSKVNLAEMNFIEEWAEKYALNKIEKEL